MLPAFIPGLVLAARGRARSWRSSSTQARIIGKSSAARGRVTFPPFSCDCPITPLSDLARTIVLEFADRGLLGQDIIFWQEGASSAFELGECLPHDPRFAIPLGCCLRGRMTVPQGRGGRAIGGAGCQRDQRERLALPLRPQLPKLVQRAPAVDDEEAEARAAAQRQAAAERSAERVRLAPRYVQPRYGLVSSAAPVNSTR